MTQAAAKASRARSGAAMHRVLLSRDDSGDWTLSARVLPACRFSEFEAALERARHIPSPQAATIEVWQGGEYICCLQPPEWPPHMAAPDAVPNPNSRVFTAFERWANRAAGRLMTVAGPLFWLTVVFVAVAASLGLKLRYL